MASLKQDLVALSDEVWERLWTRFEGLTDDEYHWQPAPGCWTIAPRRDGSYECDSSLPPPDPGPFTTIAWRLWHLIDMYGENRAPRWLDVAPQGDAVGLDAPDAAPPIDAASALALLDRAHARWDAHLAIASEASLAENVGPVGGGYAERTRAAYVLHMLDEFIHHSAEISMLRDLWRWQRPLPVDPLTEKVMRGDVTVLDDVDPGEGGDDLVEVAARYARWELLVALLDAGLPVGRAATTPLHRAAGAGELAAVESLLSHGADLGARDPEFHATPLQWADFLGSNNVAELLRNRTPD